ncbi:MAG: hypothetical protein V4734_00970, partial [Terriglobus sp.]
LTSVAAATLWIFSKHTNAQQQELPPLPMAQSDATDTYAIYSSLLPLGETAAWKASFYAVRDVTVNAIPADAPCMAPTAKTAMERAMTGTMNPHNAVTPPADQRQDYEEILSDFDSHCHDRIALAPEGWNAKLPVTLLNEQQQAEYTTSRNVMGKHTPYDGSPSLYAFGRVFFNAHHTTALVYATHWCGGLCGEGFWIALHKENGQWKRLHWNSASWIS